MSAARRAAAGTIDWRGNTTSPVTFWVANNHGASIIKLETLD
jgi:hypothetical protein